MAATESSRTTSGGARRLRSASPAGRASVISGSWLKRRMKRRVDPVLPAPDPRPLERPAPARRHRVAVPRADQAQEAALGVERPRRLSPQGAAEVGLQRAALADREDARLLARVPHHRGDVAGREHRQDARVPPAWARRGCNPARRPRAPTRAASAGAAAAVAHITSSTSTARPPSTTTRPASTRTTRRPRWTWTPRSRRTRAEAGARARVVGRQRLPPGAEEMERGLGKAGRRRRPGGPGRAGWRGSARPPPRPPPRRRAAGGRGSRAHVPGAAPSAPPASRSA